MIKYAPRYIPSRNEYITTKIYITIFLSTLSVIVQMLTKSEMNNLWYILKMNTVQQEGWTNYNDT